MSGSLNFINEKEVIKNREELKQKEAKWLSDLETLKKHHSKFARDSEGYLIKDTKENAKNYMRVSIENSDRFVEEENEKIRNEKNILIKESYDDIIEVLKQYLDLKEEYYPIIALWIIGTYIHKQFDSYPYLFFNAMRGSGKSRTLRLICALSKDGMVMASPTEAVLFRITGTLGIDEFEGIANKDKSSIRELLNGAYKKGIKIIRMKRKKTLEGEQQVAEEFEPYRPIVMANINGMDEVLGDRCLTLILEKSNNPMKTRLVEDFQNNKIVQKVSKTLNQCSLCSVVVSRNIYTDWNNYIIDRYKTTLTTYYTLTTLTTLTTPNIKLTSLFNKIHDTEIIGRNLELFLPIFFLADIISEEVFNQVLLIAKNITKEKKGEEEMESIDVMVYDFVSRQSNELIFRSVNDMVMEFRQFSNESYEWLNAKWFGKALKRLNLVLDKKRKGHGIEVLLNVNKAIEKLKMFSKN
jgi:hypothetical protein